MLGVIVAASVPATLTLHSKPAAESMSSIGVFGDAPFRVLYPGETFSLTLYANSGSNSVDGFQLKLFYDPSILAFEEFMLVENFACAFLPRSLATSPSLPLSYALKCWRTMPALSLLRILLTLKFSKVLVQCQSSRVHRHQH